MGAHDKPGLGGRKDASDAEPQDLTSYDERRGAVRRPTFKAAEIVLSDGRTLSCIVRNISDSGCLMKLENADTLPDYIDIRIDLDKPSRAAEVVWRSTSLAGAMFIRKPS